MDANRTRFHLLLGRQDWARCRDADDRPLGELWKREPTDVAYDEEREELTLQPLPFRFPAGATATVLELQARRGAARDRYGNWYWIDAVPTAVLVNSAGTGATTRFWTVDDPTAPRRPRPPRQGRFRPLAPTAPLPPLRLAGAAVTDDHYLVVGVAEPPGLLVFDLRAGGPPAQLLWPAVVPFAPFDMAARPGGGVFVLDREHRRYWELDRHLLVVSRRPDGGRGRRARAFEPVTGRREEAGMQVRFQPPALEDAVALEGPAAPDAAGPVAVESMPDGTVLVLHRDDPTATASSVRAYRDGAALGLAVATADPTVDLSVVGHDLAFVAAPDPRRPAQPGRLFVVDQRGDQAFEFTVELDGGGLRLSSVERYYPMRLFGGKGLVAAAGQAYYDLGDRWFPLAEQRLRRFRERAVVLTDILDGQEPGCVWHRLLLDACMPAGDSAVRVWSAASDEPQALAAFPRWIEEPAPYPRGDGSEQPFAPADPTGDHRTWELLFQRAHGRHLRLKLELDGNGRSTPRLRALRAYFPRFSYLERYLPAVYREDESSASFLDRFLANLEGISTAIEDRIAAAQLLFHPATTPGDALEWLASWFELAMDPAWDDAKRRLLIGHAMEFLQWRGTIRGLQTALALAMEDRLGADLFADYPPACARRARIVERYQTKITPGVALGDPTEADAAPPAPFGRWRPADGVEELDRGYREMLRAAGLDADDAVRFPSAAPDDPGDPDRARRVAAWTSFARRVLGFVPAAGPDLAASWRDFLARRYRRVADLNAAYQLPEAAAFTSFDQVPLPAAVPTGGPALTDWFQFQGAVLPARRTAHRFRVLLPVPAGTRTGDGGGAARDHAARLALARRIVELEKPAHTTFDVKFYWEAFRVGEARLGLDTLIDLGGRSPSLLGDAVLGRSYLGESQLASPSASTSGQGGLP
jgi:phage tail-like protein